MIEHAVARFVRGDHRDRLPEDLPAGAQALRALLELCARNDIQRAARDRSRFAPRPPQIGPLRGALWRRAVEHQAIAWQQDEASADAQITSVANHFGELLRRAPWATTEPALLARAIAEAVDHVVDGRPVASLPAHQAWRQLWRSHQATSWGPLADVERTTGVEGRPRSAEALGAEWLDAWDRWAQTRTP